MPEDPTPAPDGAPPVPGAPTPDKPAAAPASTDKTPTADKSTSTEDMTTVVLRFPHDEFHSGVDGVPPITREPTEIPTASLEAVLIAARKSRVTVTTIEEEK
jgi:hypothetical protein